MPLHVNHINHSFPAYPRANQEAFEASLDKIDPYSLESFRDVLDARTEQDLELYIVVIQEDGYSYFVEGSRFLEQEFKGNLRNPFTNNYLDKYTFLIYSHQENRFEHYCDSSQAAEPLWYYPVLMSDHTRPSDDRWDYCHKTGCIYLQPAQRNLEKAFDYLEQAANAGLKKSQKLLATVKFENGDQEKGIFWLKEYLKGINPEPLELIFLADQLRKVSLTEALPFFEQAALMGNHLALANVIDMYEQLKDQRNVARWRESLPVEWTSKSMGNFTSHLKDIKYDPNTTHQKEPKNDLARQELVPLVDF